MSAGFPFYGFNCKDKLVRTNTGPRLWSYTTTQFLKLRSQRQHPPPEIELINNLDQINEKQSDEGIHEVEVPLLKSLDQDPLISNLHQILDSSDSDNYDYDCCFVFPTTPNFVARETFGRAIRTGCSYRDYMGQPFDEKVINFTEEAPDDLLGDLSNIYTSTCLSGFSKPLI